jgi:hypothetical protein
MSASNAHEEDAAAAPPASVSEKEAVTINGHQKEFVRALKAKIKTLEGGARLELVHRPPMYHGGKPKLADFYLKPVIALVPELNFPGVELKCPDCQHTVKRCGFSNNPIARYIHDLHSGIYLMQAQYECCSMKCTMGGIKAMKFYAEQMMPSLPAYCQAQFPVELYHKTGISKDMMVYITSDAVSGKSIEEIGKLIGTFRAAKYLERNITYTSAVKEYKNRIFVSEENITDVEAFSAFDDKIGYNEVQQLTAQAIRDIFVNYIEDKDRKKVFDTILDNIPVPFAISIDSTFRVRKHTHIYGKDSKKCMPVEENALSLVMSGNILFHYI